MDAVQNYFDHMNADRFDLLARQFTPDAEVTVPGAATVRGRAAIEELYGRIFGPWPEHHDDPVRIVRAGRTVTVNVDFTGRLDNGAELTFAGLDVFDLDEAGLIERLTNWYDSHAVRRRMAAAAESATPPDLEPMRRFLQDQGIARSLGITCEALGRGTARISMTPDDDVRHDTGAVPGPLLTALADVVASYAIHTVVERTDLHMTTDLSSHFLDAALDVPLVAEGRVERQGARQVFASATVTDGSGRLCLRAFGTWAVKPDSPHALLRDLP